MTHTALARPRLLEVTGTPQTGYFCRGRHLTGVTTVIGSVLRAPQLEEWMKLMGRQADVIRDEAAAYGKSIHAALAAYCRGDRLLPLDMPEAWWATVEAGRRWIDENIDEVYAVEEPVASLTYGYAGTPDLYGRRIGRKSPCVVDWKTPRNLYPSHRAQTAAYRRAVVETYGDKPGERVVLLLSKEEPGRVHAHVLREHTTDFALFGHLLAAHRILKAA